MFGEREVVVHASTDDVKVLKAAFVDSRMMTEIKVWDKEEELGRSHSSVPNEPTSLSRSR